MASFASTMQVGTHKAVCAQLQTSAQSDDSRKLAAAMMATIAGLEAAQKDWSALSDRLSKLEQRMSKLESQQKRSA